ncbi:mannose-6-phosphate isomerase, class I [Diaminobutyricimonas sp. TR449]|uniref:mannose-6-phosphate isomerase, class I n=1 Tax=Diaminobutyricimonas sp. TR449 TaxID=2708076 RepID=UPI00142485EC|nr:mannose-6-phosphate isomerase, class I [Diaminobutyricimonas sp. TR449]
MFVGITNDPRPYAWGSKTAIAEALGREASGNPEAELWLGTHPGSPSRIVDASPVSNLASKTTLPFLLKLLAAETPLSLQAHPTLVQAALGFSRENAEGLALDAPTRNYKDTLHKPELIFALSEHFEALCGFRPVDQTRELVSRLRALDVEESPLDSLLTRLDDLRGAFEWLISGGPDVSALVDRTVELCRRTTDTDLAYGTVRLLATEYPSDPGIVISLLLNRVSLRRGEVLYLPAGNIHAYLHGFGVELMAASDNVLRGGLTPKHVDVPELLAVLDFSPVPVPYLEPASTAENLEVFEPDVPDFVLAHVTGRAKYPLPGAAIALVLDGEFTLKGSRSKTVLRRGEAAYVSPEELSLSISGEGELFIASTHLPEGEPQFGG